MLNRLLYLICISFLVLPAKAQADSEWVNPQSANYITPDDFPATANPSKKSRIQEFIGHKNYYNKLRYFYTNLDEVYRDFNIDPNVVMDCDRRHQNSLDKRSGSFMTLKAQQYFCLGDYNTSYCHKFQKRKVNLGMCLDLDDTLDWVALQGALLNAKGRSVLIPHSRTFNINQSLIIPSNTKVVWDSTGGTYHNGRSWIRPGASFIKLNQIKLDGFNGPEPIPNRRGLGFSIGTTVTVADTPFLYGNRVAILKDRVAENVTLYYPHIDSSNYFGENGLSFAQGVQNVTIYGGHIKNIKINSLDEGDYKVAYAGGKAIQCEAGCQEIQIEGLNITNAHIGINSNAIEKHQDINLLPVGSRISDISVDGVIMENVDIPVNVLNDMPIVAGTQRVRVNNFLFKNCGHMPTSTYLERYNEPRPTYKYSNVINGALNIQYAPNVATTYDHSPIMSRGGFNVWLTNGRLINESSYGGVDALFGGFGSSSKIVNMMYSTRFNCTHNPHASGC